MNISKYEEACRATGTALYLHRHLLCQAEFGHIFAWRNQMSYVSEVQNSFMHIFHLITKRALVERNHQGWKNKSCTNRRCPPPTILFRRRVGSNMDTQGPFIPELHLSIHYLWNGTWSFQRRLQSCCFFIHGSHPYFIFLFLVYKKTEQLPYFPTPQVSV